MKFYQGDTIQFDVVAGEGFDPDQLDFQVLIYNDTGDHALITKEDMERQQGEAWRGTISSKATAGMSTGRYMIEVMIRQSDNLVSIAKAEAFVLEESRFKKCLK